MITPRICPKHGKPYPVQEWRGKMVEDNCPDCTREFVAALTKGHQHD